MKIIVVDKLYYPYSGIQDYVIDLVRLLRLHGHEVIVSDGYTAIDVDLIYNAAIENHIPKKNIWYALNALYSFKAKKSFGKLLDKEKPDVVHISNIHHNVSPSILYEAKKRHIPIVYQLHDYKIVCPIYKLFRSEKLCTSCANGNFQNCVRYRCSLHRDHSLKESLFLYAESILHHTILDVYDMVDVFIAPSMYVKAMHEEMGFKGPIIHISHFVFPPAKKTLCKKSKRNAIVYVGRVVREKGLMTLLGIASRVKVDVDIVGTGDAESLMKKYCSDRHISTVHYLGFLPKKELQKRVASARVTILPSLWPEPFGRAIIESFSLGIPVIASNVGGIPEIVEHEKNGYLIRAGDEEGLKNTIDYVLRLSQTELTAMGVRAYNSWKEQFNPDRYYQELIHVYQTLLVKKPEKRLK